MRSRHGNSLLGGLSARSFLQRYWQKRPLLVRGAMAGFRDPLTRASFLELASHPEVESRLVLERGGRRPWQVVPGPQDPSRLRRLGASHWTLLVQEANQHVPAFAELLERFSFVPRWRVDDVMVSFAPRYGSVGPHVDGYDVFLLQGSGRRRWRIARRFDAACREGLDLSVLRRFRPEREWVLDPGDMLYLPPGVAHHGVALEDCFTYSIGFRAPSRAELVLGLAESVARSVPSSDRYADPDLAPARHSGAISSVAVRRLRAMLERDLAVSGDRFAEFVGRLLTRPVQDDTPLVVARPLSAAAFRKRLSASPGLLRSDSSRLAYVARGRGIWLFVDGVAHELPARLAFAGPLLTDRRFIPRSAVLPRLRTSSFVRLLCDLVSRRVFGFAPTALAPKEG
jgi:50S ribosomal protein L16 3-hydroxylase